MAPPTLARRSVGEWRLRSDAVYASPFADVQVSGSFVAPSGTEHVMPGFHDGDGTWVVRFNPGETGAWRYRLQSRPADPALAEEGRFEVTERPCRGFLRATPGEAWGFTWESGSPAFLFGDTVYNLFGMAHCGGDVEGFLRRRAQQGFNLLRIRVPVSSFHPPDGHSDWQTRRTWAWGGSEQAPRFDLFSIEWFRTVDSVMSLCEQLELGVELIMEGWGFEFPFNHRAVFTTEWEELWLRYLIARYDAYNCLAIWTPLNEYEYFPNGDWNYKPTADRWAIRVARWIKATAAHGHVVAMHNGPRLPPFAERFAADPQAVDAILFQEWGSRDADHGWLAAGIEGQIAESLVGWTGSAVLAEWGYERNAAFALKLPPHEFCDRDHTRRGGWRGAFCALGLIHGFENSWGPWMELEEDQPGLADLLLLRSFLTDVVPFAELRPAPSLVKATAAAPGFAPLLLASGDLSVIAAYLPAGGTLTLTVDPPAGARWFDPRTGALTPAKAIDPGVRTFRAPAVEETAGRPSDWALILGASERTAEG